MKLGNTVTVLVVLILAAAVATPYVFMTRARAAAPPAPELTTPYQAVLLANGSVYFGKLEGLGTPYPVLRDVYYVQSGVDQQTKALNNVLIKRGKEWHAPDRMIINAADIVFVEPVTPGSRVAQLISQSPQ